jgi:hypothetical protein
MTEHLAALQERGDTVLYCTSRSTRWTAPGDNTLKMSAVSVSEISGCEINPSTGHPVPSELAVDDDGVISSGVATVTASIGSIGSIGSNDAVTVTEIRLVTRLLPAEAAAAQTTCRICFDELDGGVDSLKLACGDAAHHHCLVRYIRSALGDR